MKICVALKRLLWVLKEEYIYLSWLQESSTMRPPYDDLQLLQRYGSLLVSPSRVGAESLPREIDPNRRVLTWIKMIKPCLQSHHLKRFSQAIQVDAKQSGLKTLRNRVNGNTTAPPTDCTSSRITCKKDSSGYKNR